MVKSVYVLTAIELVNDWQVDCWLFDGNRWNSTRCWNSTPSMTGVHYWESISWRRQSDWSLYSLPTRTLCCPTTPSHTSALKATVSATDILAPVLDRYVYLYDVFFTTCTSAYTMHKRRVIAAVRCLRTLLSQSLSHSSLHCNIGNWSCSAEFHILLNVKSNIQSSNRYFVRDTGL